MSGDLQPISPHDLPAPPVPGLPADPLDRLPLLTGNSDPYWRLVTAFLVGYPPHSLRAYFSDLKAWYAWCARSGVHPLAARRHHVDVWVRHLSQDPQPSTGRPASPASIARRLSCLSKFYDYGIKDAELLEHSPVANVRRPKVSDDSSTVGLTADELDRCSPPPKSTVRGRPRSSTTACASPRSSPPTSRISPIEPPNCREHSETGHSKAPSLVVARTPAISR